MSTIVTADNLLKKKYGVFMHFLQHDRPEGWNKTVENFDVPALARDLYDVGAGWFFITLMQGRKYMCAPNATYDEIAGTRPGEACSLRDLPQDIIRALSPLGIDTCLYYTGDGPYKDEEIGKHFGFTEPRELGVTRPFVEKWSSVLREYALRYGDAVKAWWIDGCYKEYFKYNDELLQLYVDACHAGNPDSLVALNNGVKRMLIRDWQAENMTCGEFNDFTILPQGRYTEGVQSHILAPLGVYRDEGSVYSSWCNHGLKHSKEHMADYVKRANELGCLVTIDIGIDQFGHIDPQQLEVLAYINEHC